MQLVYFLRWIKLSFSAFSFALSAFLFLTFLLALLGFGAQIADGETENIFDLWVILLVLVFSVLFFYLGKRIWRNNRNLEDVLQRQAEEEQLKAELGAKISQLKEKKAEKEREKKKYKTAFKVLFNALQNGEIQRAEELKGFNVFQLTTERERKRLLKKLSQNYLQGFSLSESDVQHFETLAKIFGLTEYLHNPKETAYFWRFMEYLGECLDRGEIPSNFANLAPYSADFEALKRTERADGEEDKSETLLMTFKGVIFTKGKAVETTGGYFGGSRKFGDPIGGRWSGNAGRIKTTSREIEEEKSEHNAVLLITDKRVIFSGESQFFIYQKKGIKRIYWNGSESIGAWRLGFSYNGKPIKKEFGIYRDNLKKDHLARLQKIVQSGLNYNRLS